MNDRLRSYPSLFNLGHKLVLDVLQDEVVVQEKVDGSQFSFGIKDGQLFARSKGQQLNFDAPEKMFSAAINTVRELATRLEDGWTYRGEYLKSPKHNTLAYSRIPEKNIILFDVDAGDHDYLLPHEVKAIAETIGLEVTPTFLVGTISDPSVLMEFLGIDSILGGCKVEGVVIKNYHRFGLDKKPLFAKVVSEVFKEKHEGEWRKSNPTRTDVIQALTQEYRTEARWEKAVQHLRDAGILTGTVKDIGLLMREVPDDVKKECKDEIMEALWRYAWPTIERGCKAGLAEWYKDRIGVNGAGHNTISNRMEP